MVEGLRLSMRILSSLGFYIHRTGGRLSED